jgi:putative membrane protein insertion efficiency factor
MLGRGMTWLGAALAWLVILPARLYQVALGPLLPKVCRYHPSCSDYFIQAVRKYGAWRGSVKGVRRICRCHPWGGSGHDPP